MLALGAGTDGSKQTAQAHQITDEDQVTGAHVHLLAGLLIQTWLALNLSSLQGMKCLSVS